MLNLVKEVSANDPVMIPEKIQVIDQILEDNKNLPGGLMVILNEVQSRIGFISEPMQAIHCEQTARSGK